MQPFHKALFLLLSFLILLNISDVPGTDNTNLKGCPFIQKIHLDNYGIENNNFSIVQDSLGNLFIGNSNGIIKYNGAFWDLIKIKGHPQLKVDNNGKIYTNSFNEIGCLYSTNRSIRFKSLTGQVTKTQIQNFTLINNNSILFNTLNELFLLKDNQVEKISEHEEQIRLHPVNNRLVYISIDNTGLYKFKEPGELEKVIDHNQINADIMSILQKGDSLILALSNYRGLKIYSNGSINNFPESTMKIFRDISVSDMIRFDQKRIAIGTETSGILILDKMGLVKNIIDEKCGLFDSKINKLFIDNNKNLWALHNFGLSRIEINPGFYYYNKKNGIDGSLTSLEQFDDKLFAGTSKGIYFLPLTQEKNTKKNNFQEFTQFEKIPEMQANVFDFYIADKKLFALTSKGIYRINDNQAFLFYNKAYKKFTTCKHSKIHPELIYIGRNDGFSVIKQTNKLMIPQGKMEQPTGQVVDIAEDKQKNTWIVTQNRGIYRIPPFEKFSIDLPIQHYPENKLYPDKDINWIKCYSTSNEILFSTSAGLFKYEHKSDSFKRYSLTENSVYDDDQWIFPVAEDNSGNLWFNIVSRTKKQNEIIVRFSEKGKTSQIKLPISRLKDFHVRSIHTKNNNTIWFGGTDGLVCFDLNKFVPKKLNYQLLLHKITLKEDSVVEYNYWVPGTAQKKEHEFSYKLNDIHFEYTATNYFSENQVSYKSKLMGYDNNWSDWHNKNYKEYTNLSEGDYIFLVKAKDIYDNESRTLRYVFSIKPPFYRSFWAYLFYLIFLGLLLLLIFKWRAYYFAKEKFKLENIIQERTEEVLLQKEKADNLLNQLLPKETANELKSGKKPGPYHFNMSTVLFGDIQGFTSITEKMEISSIINKLDEFFLEFDNIVEKYNIEKIKTMGDAYMCAGGIPVENNTNPVEVVLAAMEMQHYMKKLDHSENKNWGLRIGIDTGEVTAGVIGKSKATYDIWGKTVNLASRIESAGVAGKINISGNTYEVIKEFFICEHRGKIPVKNHGNVDMYFVEGFKPQFARKETPLLPNDQFMTQLKLLKLNDLEEEILGKMEKDLPSDLYYHNVKHTIDVMTQVELIGKSENISDEEMLILKTAALFHDIGHLVDYDNHEEEGVKIARRILPEYNYTPEQIAQIEKLIMVTQMPPKPNTLLEMIICDADLDYLGRSDFVPVAYNLYRELKIRNKVDSFEEWKKIQIDFIRKHSYFTKTAQKLRDVNKKNQLEKIMKEMRD